MRIQVKEVESEFYEGSRDCLAGRLTDTVVTPYVVFFFRVVHKLCTIGGRIPGRQRAKIRFWSKG